MFTLHEVAKCPIQIIKFLEVLGQRTMIFLELVEIVYTLINLSFHHKYYTLDE